MQGFCCFLALCREVENKRTINWELLCLLQVPGEIMHVGKNILATSWPSVFPLTPGLVLLCVLTSCVQHPTIHVAPCACHTRYTLTCLLGKSQKLIALRTGKKTKLLCGVMRAAPGWGTFVKWHWNLHVNFCVVFSNGGERADLLKAVLFINR